jgi:hypothetical protein
VLNFTVNDAEPVPHEKRPSLLLRHCYSCIYVAGRVDTLLRQISTDPDWASYYLGLFGDGSTPGWLDAKASIKKLADYCRQRGIKFLIVNHPELHDVQHYPCSRSPSSSAPRLKRTMCRLSICCRICSVRNPRHCG